MVVGIVLIVLLLAAFEFAAFRYGADSRDHSRPNWW